MKTLKEKFADKALPLAEEVKNIRKEHGDKKISDVSIEQLFGGMKGVKSLVTETSQLDPHEGIRFRGYTIPQLQEKLPKAPNGGDEPLPEGIFYLMLIGELPSEEDVKNLSQEWAKRADVPSHVFQTLDAMPRDTHPMTQFSTAILTLQNHSEFAKAYREGKVSKKDYWDPMYEDVMNLIAKLPRIAAYIFRRTYFHDEHIEPDKNLDWSANLAHMLGFKNDDVKRLMRLYTTIHADHEGGNVSAHTTHLVCSALSDAYQGFSAGMNGLAGPLHGLANQEVIRWINKLRDELGGGKPSNEQIEQYVRKTLDSGQLVPGFGHAVLRKTDPRYTAQREFADKYIEKDDIVQIVRDLKEIVPPILQETGKVSNPWPNVDAHSGSLLMHYGIIQYDFYTVLFGVSRSLGVLASLCWDRALGMPIERPKSVTTEWVKQFVQEEVGQN